MKTFFLRILTVSETNNNYCSCKCREGKLNVSTIDLQGTQNEQISTAIPKANLLFLFFLFFFCTTVWFLHASHVASSDPSPIKIVRLTYDWHVTLFYVAFAITSVTAAKTGKTRGTRMITFLFFFFGLLEKWFKNHNRSRIILQYTVELLKLSS